MSELYRHFGKPWDHVLDFTDVALLSLYNHESYGTPLSQKNGFAQGKKQLNLQVNAWKEMLREGTLAKFELYQDYPDWGWWLDSILENTYTGMSYNDILTSSRIAGSIGKRVR